MKKITTLFCLTLLVFGATAQNGKWELGGYIGYANYLGDLVEPSFTFDQSSLAGGLLLRYQLLDRLQIRSNLVVGKLKGDDENYNSNRTRSANFTNVFSEFSLMGEYEFFKINRNGSSLLEKVSPYAFGGVGFDLLNLDSEIGSNTPEAMADLRYLKSDIIPVVPLGGGIKYAVSKNITVGLEIGIRLTFTDYLDGVSQSGDPTNDDVYFSGGVSVAYLFGNNDMDNDGIVDRKDACPTLPGPLKFNGCPDTDGDGIVDSEDKCPKEYGKALLDGCPDSDDDVVPDHLDDCPDDKGIRRFGGCPDTDGDGIVDLEDNCPDVPGIPSLNGCPDSDRDGVTDERDECPLEPGPTQLNGCPDADNDGIPDKDDDCPLKPGKLANRGCPDLDTDGDGLIDRKDLCPELAGPLENNGCPEISPEDRAILTAASQQVMFQDGTEELLPSSQVALDQVFSLMKKYKGYRLRIHGHTDNLGDPEEKRTLSEDRAQACYAYFFGKGINPTKLSYTGFGGTVPIANNGTEEGLKLNNRIEFIMTIEDQ